MKITRPEILAPCGSYEILEAAIKAGADACYLGGFRFGARAYAENFSNEDIIRAIDFAHIHEKKVFLTLNTLLKEDEIDEVYQYLDDLYYAGLDGIIVQDLGVFRYVRNVFPELPLHASTQMNITSINGAKKLKEIGAKRVVLAREMSLDEIKYIKSNLDIELEAFVHGAMCYSYSGRCHMSECLGTRSGNRGRCAQPCRRPYSDEYILSLKDMCTLEILPELIDAGIDSLKIEGRMKNANYVCSSVAAYREISDMCLAGEFNKKSAEEKKFILANMFNRGGFSKSFYVDEKGPDMITFDRPDNQGVIIGTTTGVGSGKVNIKLSEELYKEDVLSISAKGNDTPIEITSGISSVPGETVSLNAPRTKSIQLNVSVYRTKCNKLINDVFDGFEPVKYSLKGRLNASVGENISFTVSRLLENGDKISTTVFGDKVDKSEKLKLDKDVILDKLIKTGNTDYYFKEITIEADDNAFIPASVLKSLRRTAISDINSLIINKSRREKPIEVPYSVFDYKSYIDNRLSKGVVCPKTRKSLLSTIRYEVTTSKQFDFLINADKCNNQELVTPYHVAKKVLFDKQVLERIINKNISITIATPYIVKNDFDIKNDFQNISEDALRCISGYYARNFDGFCALAEYLKETNNSAKITLATDVYAYNSLSRSELLDIYENIAFVIPYELNSPEYSEIKRYSDELVIYEHKKAMVAASCVARNKGCCTGGKKETSKDINIASEDHEFTCRGYCEECVGIIYDTVPVLVLDTKGNQATYPLVDGYRVTFTTETDEELKVLFDNFVSGDFSTVGNHRKSNERGIL